MNALQATATAEPVSARASAEPPRLSGPQVITASLIDAVGTSGCGWSRMQIEILGASWPLEAGWREKLVAEGRTLSAEEVEALYAARKAQRTVEADPAEIPVLPCPWCSKPVQRTEHGGHLKEFCNRRHKTAFNNALTKASIAHSRLLRIPGALQAWAKGGVNPSPDGGGALPRTTEGAGKPRHPLSGPRQQSALLSAPRLATTSLAKKIGLAMTVSTLQITAVKPNNYNPNHMGPDKFAELVEEIRHLGRLPKPITRTGNCRFPRSTPTTRAS